MIGDIVYVLVNDGCEVAVLLPFDDYDPITGRYLLAGSFDDRQVRGPFHGCRSDATVTPPTANLERPSVTSMLTAVAAPTGGATWSKTFRSWGLWRTSPHR
jgi:hypothetical protein